MADIKKADEIINENYKVISDVRDSILFLNEKALEFVENLDNYNKKYLYDASILKKRMSDAVRKAASNDI